MAAVGGTFYGNCLYASFAHFPLDSCLSIDLPVFCIFLDTLGHLSPEFLSDSDIMKLAAHLPGIWHCHYLAGKAQEVRGLCTVAFSAPTLILPRPQSPPSSILSLGLSTDTLPTAAPVPHPVPAPVQALFCVVSIHSSRNEAALPGWGICCLPFKARLAYLIFQGAFPDCPCSLLSATLSVVLAPPLRCWTTCKSFNFSLPTLSHLQNGIVVASQACRKD